MNPQRAQSHGVKVTGIHLGNLMGVCFYAWHVPSMLRRRLQLGATALESWLPSNAYKRISMWATGAAAKETPRRGHVDLLSNVPRPQIEPHPFHCTANTETEQEIKEDITRWSRAKSAPSPSLPRMECWRIQGL